MLRIIILLIAVGAGGLAFWLVFDAPQRDAVATANVPVVQATVEVLVAAIDLSQGQVLEQKSLRWQSWPKDAVSAGFVSREATPDALASFTGALVRSRFVAGEPIREQKLSHGSAGMLAALLPPGKRAIAIRVSAESAAGGFILPNDRVDVIQNITTSSDGRPENRSRTLLRNVRVLAVDQRADETTGELVVVGKTATLELKPDQVELITAAEASGTLSLSLRSIADTDEVVSAREQKQSGTVRIFRGGRGQVLTTQ